MAFNLTVWQEETRDSLQNVGQWLAKVKDTEAPLLLYGYLSGLTLLPLALAAQSGNPMPVALALGGLFGGVGGNLLANKVQAWANRAGDIDETELATRIIAEIPHDAALRDEINTVLEKLDVIAQVYQGLNEADRRWFSDTLQQELAQLGSLKRLEASLSGAGIIIQDSLLKGGRRSVVGSQAETIITGDRNRVAGTIIEQQNIYQTPPGTGPAALRLAYLNHLFETTGQLSLTGVDPKAAGSEAEARLNLGAVYTALLTLSPEHHDRLLRGELPSPSGRGAGGEGQEPRRLSALEQLDNHARLVLLGDPGSGKSTFVNFVTTCLTGEILANKRSNLALLTAPLPDNEGRDEEQPQPWQHRVLLPVRVILRDFAARGLPDPGQTATAKHLWDFIASELEATAGLAEYAPQLRQELREQGGLLLLDGLDEVPAARQRRVQLKEAVESFAAAYPRCRLLVTGRTYAYQKQAWRLSGFAEAVLAPFSAGQIRRFVGRWYAHIAELRGMHRDDAQGRAEILKRAIFGNERLAELAERPLLLTLMASLHAWRGGSLPENREELYADTVDLLLDWWESPKVVRDTAGQVKVLQPSLAEWLKIKDRKKVQELLNDLAYQAHTAQPELVGTADVDEGKLVSGLMRLSQNPDVKTARLVEYLSQRAGLLLPRGVGVYTFPHRTFQEYLAACYLTGPGYPNQVAQLARQKPERWREVALLAGAKATRGSDFAGWALVEALCYREPETPAREEADTWGALLAGQMLVETISLEQISEQDKAKVERVKRWLANILEAGLLPAVERAAAGRSLAVLGDERPGVGLRSISPPLKGEGPGVLPDLIWCDVTAGPFIMGSLDDSLGFSWAKETPQREVNLPTFRISRYPITNAQYAAFVKAGGYGEAGYWTAAAANGYWQGGRVRRLGSEWAERPYDYGPPFNLPNHPVVGVNWYEAIAFCAWLTEQLRAAGELDPNDEITLPTESQWEKAARGTDGRLYPWGSKPEPELANSEETGLGSTTAVGCFPGGAGPYGVQDMSGNVWEWCRTKFEESYQDYRDDNTLEQYTSRVLRGGSFANEQDKCRCAARYNSDPNRRLRHFGFRVVASPSTSGL